MTTFYSFVLYLSPTLFAWLQASKYILLFLGALFEGPVIMLASGFLYRINSFELLPMYIALVSGDFVADIGWYCVGRFGGRPIVLKWGHRFGITLKSIEKIEERFKRYHDKILIISKLTMGFGFALVTLVVAGMLRVSFKKYAVLNLIGGFVWTAVLLLVGYFFGNIYASITGPEKIVFAICLFALAVTAFKLANKYLITQNI